MMCSGGRKEGSVSPCGFIIAGKEEMISAEKNLSLHIFQGNRTYCVTIKFGYANTINGVIAAAMECRPTGSPDREGDGFVAKPPRHDRVEAAGECCTMGDAERQVETPTQSVGAMLVNFW